jgi:hypothetical protein
MSCFRSFEQTWQKLLIIWFWIHLKLLHLQTCNTPCFCLVSTSANDHFNQVFNYPWSTLGQILAQNPSQPLDLPCPSRTFVTFSKIQLNTSVSPNVKVVQFVEAHNFHVEWYCQFARENGEKCESTHVSTIGRRHNNPHLAQQFI